MAYQKYEVNFPRLSAQVLEQWRSVPAAVASDCMNRIQVMGSAIKPIFTGARLCGQARTVVTMVGDCGPICNLIRSVQPGDIVVVDAGAADNVAVWGGMMAEEAVRLGVGGAVVDGAIRDVADMRRLNFPMFCRSVVPRGPHHGFGGVIDTTIAAGGAPVSPGDLVLGDDDGVVIVPLAMADQVLQAALAHMEKEAKWIREMHAGAIISDLFNMTKDTVLARS